MKRFLVPLVVTLCLLATVTLPVPVAAIPAAKDTWVSVRTKNFFLLGNAGEKEIKRVGLKLEQFREAFTRLFPTVRFNTPVPTTVIVFKSDDSYRPFKPMPNVAGYFQPGPDVNYITLTTETHGEQDPFTIIFHEYTHLLVENTLDNAPVWFNEGLAEYYSTFTMTDDQKFMVGKPISNHIYKLRDSNMLTLPTLFKVDHNSPHYNEKTKSSIFYAQSWALMHYLLIGKQGRAEQLAKFVDLLRAKAPVEQAFQQAFQVPFDTMEKELYAYVEQSRYNVLHGEFREKIALDANTEVAMLSEAEVQAYLGDLLLHSNRAEASSYLQKALELDPNLAMAHASLGMVHVRYGNVREARASLEKAVAANSQNFLIHYYYAVSLSRNGINDAPAGGYSPEDAAKIREHLQKAIALRPDFPESYALLAYVNLVTHKDIDESIASLKRVLSASPGLHHLTFMLGQLYMAKNDYKTARGLLEQVTKSNAAEEIRKHAEQLLAQMIKMEEQKALYDEAKKKVEAQNAATAASSNLESAREAPPNDPSYYLRDALRKPAAGETQLQATLVKIECEPKGAMVFVVQTATGLLRLRAANFNAVEITTYDPKVAGEITCGTRTWQNVVVLCYVPNTNKLSKMDGTLKSIEFVPPDFKLKP